MLIYEGQKLENYKRETLKINPNWNRRDFVSCVKDYINCVVEKILLIGGLLGTGKTVGILQAAENCDSAYLLSQKDEKESADDYIDFLKNSDKKVIVFDEYSRIKDRDKLDRYLLTAVQNDKRIIITATEYIPLEYLNYGALNHRVQIIHTTMFTYEEYLRLHNKEHSKVNRKAFLMTGGMFEEYIIQDFASAKQYIDDAIVSNLAAYLKNEMSEDEAKSLTYSVIYKAIYPDDISKIPALREKHITLGKFLKQMGVHTNHVPEKRVIQRVADIFEQAGIIVRITNFDEESAPKERYYLANSSLTCQLIKATYGLNDIESSVLNYYFEFDVN